jgi:4-amino-4-deoxy-L-arabinose transferase-like glycosyltransferase
MRPPRDLVLGLTVAALVVAARYTAPVDMKSNDQAKSAQYVLYTWHTGEFLVPLEQGRFPPTKPPLAAWVALPALWLAGGPTEVGLRIVIALEALVFIALTVLLARRILPPPGPAITGVVAATTYLFLKGATFFRPDMLMGTLVLASLLAAFRALLDDRRGYGVLAFALLGLAVLAKGPIALLFFGAGVIPWALLRRNRLALLRLRLPVGAVVLLLVVAAWAVPAMTTDGRALYETMITGELSKHTGGGRQPFYQYLLLFPGRFLPWLFLLPSGIALAVRNRREDPTWPLGFPLLFFAASVIGLSFVSSKRADYLLPAVPGAAMLVAAWLGTRRHGVAIALGGAALFTAGILVAFLGFPGRVAEPTTARDFVRAIPTTGTRPEDVRLFHLRSSTNVVLFHLGRADPPLKVEGIREILEREGSVRVATNADGREKLREAGLLSEVLLRREDPEEGTYLLLGLRFP